MLFVPLTTEIEQRLGELARRRGQFEADLACELIEASIEDLDDIELAASRLSAREPALTSGQARKALAGRLNTIPAR